MAQSKPKTRQRCETKLTQFVGEGKDFNSCEVPTFRAVMQRGILFQELKSIKLDIERKHYPVEDIAGDIAPLVIEQWRKANAKFSSPVVIETTSVVRKI